MAAKQKHEDHGGARKGAGRPVIGTVRMVVKVLPETARNIRTIAAEKTRLSADGKKKIPRTPGEYLDECFSDQALAEA